MPSCRLAATATRIRPAGTSATCPATGGHENSSAEGVGIGGGIAQGPEGYPGHVTVYVEVPDVEAALAKAEHLGGARMMGPEQVMEDPEIGLFTDPEGHVVGVLRSTGSTGSS
ncbi:MAG TPA: hypothetical protein VFZ77_04500 [Acidimicrobiales bacterium]